MTYEYIRQSPRVADIVSVSDFEGLLRHLYLLLGLRAENMISTAQAVVLIDFLKSEFPNIRIKEIEWACKMSISGKFENEIVNYQSIDCKYIAQLLNEYKKYVFKNRLFEKKEELKPETIDEEKIVIDYMNEFFVPKYLETIKLGKCAVIDDYGVIYRYFEKIGKIKVTTEQKKVIMKREMDKIVMPDDVRSKHDRIEFKKFKNGAKDNKYYARAKSFARYSVLEEFIKNEISKKTTVDELMKNQKDISCEK
jgi:hypothetical protein